MEEGIGRTKLKRQVNSEVERLWRKKEKHDLMESVLKYEPVEKMPHFKSNKNKKVQQTQEETYFKFEVEDSSPQLQPEEFNVCYIIFFLILI